MTLGQGADLSAHLTYFDPRTQASFVWDGSLDSIEVSIGGYGEPVDHEIPAPEQLTLPAWSVVGVLGTFQNTCRAHADTLPTYGQEDR